MVNAGAEGKAPPTPRRRADGLSLPFTMLSPHGATPSPWGHLCVAIDDVGQLFEVQPSALEPWPFRSHLCRYRAHLVPAGHRSPPPLEPSREAVWAKKNLWEGVFLLPGNHPGTCRKLQVSQKKTLRGVPKNALPIGLLKHSVYVVRGWLIRDLNYRPKLAELSTL